MGDDSAWLRVVANFASTHVPSNNESQPRGSTDDKPVSERGTVETLHLAAPGSKQSSPAHLDLPSGNDESPTGHRKEDVDLYCPNIVVFGESGVGKSSVINLIANEELARTSNGALGCTFRHDRYPITLGKTSCTLWDTTGLDEGSEGTVPAKEAENSLRELMQQLARSGGIHLIIYCIRSTRLTRALKRNYDLFYVTVCRKKVPVALVVTGLEHQEGEMETWWTENEAALQRHGMRFDAHVCVTTLDVEDESIRQRRSTSQEHLRRLVVHYSGLPAWKTDASFLSRVLPSFRSVLRGSSPTNGPKTIRKVAVCCSSTDSLPGTIVDQAGSARQIGNERYVFIKMVKRTPHTLTSEMSKKIGGVGLLVFYVSAVVNNDKPISSTDIEALETFYDAGGGQTCPMIVVLRDCDNEVVEALRNKIASRRSDIKADFVTLPSRDDTHPNLNLDEMIESRYIEQVKFQTRNLLRKPPPPPRK